ncbi:NAD(P)/FAD-dependent oxidoreductase [Streptomyces sp. NPDC006645]|uniref:flavin-containing monooxygenase n=1 Tax=unclassified Streptomyces TaxID=2593676 RepID=UPI0033A5C5C4
MSGEEPLRVFGEEPLRRPGAAGEPGPYDVVVVGAGLAGLYALHRLRGLGLRTLVLEAADGVGGTWYWNRYPGARCDVESTFYSYSFSPELEQEWEWSERYAGQPEILRYLDHVADRFDLRRDIRLGTRVVSAHFDETGHRWRIRTDDGTTLTASYCVMATGCLSHSRLPDVEGLEDFAGSVHRTARWPHEGVDFTGRRVAVVGTGSSAVQAIPLIARQAARLTVFQRTPNFSLPARNRPLDPAERSKVKRHYPRLREEARRSVSGVPQALDGLGSALAVSPAEREARYRQAWEASSLFSFAGTYGDLITDSEANETAGDFVRARIREKVNDTALAERLVPRHYPFGAKRLCLDSGYYETFNRPDVELVDLRSSPLIRVTRRAVVTATDEYPVDSIVFATGFDAMSGALLAMDIRGRSGRTLAAAWAEGPRTYLGLAVSGFPNLFLVTGPGSPSVLSNMVLSIEQHIDWVAGALQWLSRRGATTFEAEAEAEADWTAHVDALSAATLLPRAASWWTGANIAGKPRTFMAYLGGVKTYRETCDAVAADGYRGFIAH